MHRWTRIAALIAIAAWVAFTAHQVSAFPSVARTTKAACAACHVNPAGGADLTDAGKAYKADNTKVPSGDVKGAEYIGSNKCKMCHLKEYKAWADSRHGHALENLAAAGADTVKAMAALQKVDLKGPAAKADECVVCHPTGFKLAGGYPQADSTANAGVAAVGCEGCHGPGSLHKAAAKDDKHKTINRAVTEAMCKNCHTDVMSPKFDFAEFKKTGVHPIPEAAPAK